MAFVRVTFNSGEAAASAVRTGRDPCQKTVEHRASRLNAERLDAAPPEAQAVYWAWQFSCEAGGGGMETFVLNNLGKHAPEVHAALVAVGACELAQLLGIAVVTALRSSHPEFERLPDTSWF